jgi:hypothetical protein
MLEYQVAIPSHNRSEDINQYSLKYLAETGVSKDRIRIFVAPDQVAAYEQNTDAGLYAEIVPTAIGIRANHNAITQFYPEGTPLVRADDDVRYLAKAQDPKTLTRVEDSHQLILDSFSNADLVGATLWGLYPIDNPFFMKPKQRYGLSFIIGQFFGAYNRQSEILGAEIKEDFERSILRFIADGIVLRFEDLTAVAGRVGGNRGGLQTMDRASMNEQGTDYLLKTYPDFVVEKKSRSNGYREIKLRNV